MAKFVGTNKEFKRYIEHQLRNLIQQLTKKHKATVGACEHCGATAELESAHLVGRDRNEIIDRILVSRTQNEIIDVDLLDFENDFKNEHTPIEKSILILCRTCHREYDGKNAISPSSGITKIDQEWPIASNFS